MSSKVLVGASAIGAFIVAQAMVTSILADIGLTIVVGGICLGLGYMLAKR